MQTLIRQNRDLRIDLFRGIALWCMFIDHLANGSLGWITLKQYGFCDAAELFVLLSGVSAGMVYSNLLDGALLRYQPEYLDVLPLYIVVMLALCVALPLLLQRPRLLLGASLGLYGMTRLFHLKMPGWAGEWYFNVLAWQVIFFIGAVSKTVPVRERYWRGWNVLAGFFAIFGLIGAHPHHLVHLVPISMLFGAIADKSNLHPFKLLSVLSLAWLSCTYLPDTAEWLRSRWATPFVLLGQHSLPVFVISVFLSIAGQAWLDTHSGWICQTLIQGFGSLVMLGMAAWAARKNQEVRDRDQSRPGVLSTAS